MRLARLGGIAAALLVHAHLLPAGEMRAGEMRAQQPESSRGARLTHALDEWVVSRYREAQLLPDTSRAPRGMVTAAMVPRVESVSDGDAMDTLYAVHFSSLRDTNGVRVGARLRLVSGSGVVSVNRVEVLARRPFRAPLQPARIGAPDDRRWRYGWAYLAVTPHVGGKSSASAYRGWVLALPADTTIRGKRERGPISH